MNAIDPALASSHPSIDPTRLAAVRARDRNADGKFVYAVVTTGVYCRPSCAARPARAENLRFFDTPDAAERQGYRPCKRCRPTEPPRAARDAALIAAACRQIEAAESAPSLDALATAAGLSPFHFHRLFRRVAGVTPAAYAAALRAGRLKSGLAGGQPVTSAIYDAGYGSSSRVYEAADSLLGMRPGTYRDGGAGETIRYAVGETSLGPVLVAATHRGVCAITLGDGRDELVAGLHARFPRATLVADDPALAGWVAQAVALVEAPREASLLPLDIRGTAFQRQVWEALRTIPSGETLSYGALAQRIGRPSAVRAVAAACAANGLAVAVPCHRVVGAGGALTGYRWGVARKRALLQRERDPGGSPTTP